MRIPIWGESWRFVWKKGLTHGGQDCLGLCDYDKKTIYLNPDQGDADLLDTIAHEVIHAGTKNALSEEYVLETGRCVAAAMLAFNYMRVEE